MSRSVIAVCIVVGLVILVFLGRRILLMIALRSILSMPGLEMPAAPAMPPVVDASMEEILVRLGEQMKEKDPTAFQGLQPGLTDEEIESIEQEAGLQFPDDMKALYKWHNGSTAEEGPITMCRFMPLDQAMAGAAQFRDELEKQSEIGRRFLQHRISWIAIFPDGFGDGYYYDPQRTQQQGNVFYNFAEGGEYVFFPSMKNLLAWALKCYEEGVFPWGVDSNGETEQGDLELWLKLRKDFGAELPGYEQ